MIVSIDWEFFGEEAICTKHFINLLLVDHYTDDKWTHGSCDRSGETLVKIWDAYVTYMKTATKDASFSVKVLQCDNPKEILLGKFAARLKLENVKVRPCAPYTQEQNGKVEKCGGDLSNVLTSKLIDCQAPFSWWEEARDHSLTARQLMASTNQHTVVRQRKQQ